MNEETFPIDVSEKHVQEVIEHLGHAVGPIIEEGRRKNREVIENFDKYVEAQGLTEQERLILATYQSVGYKEVNGILWKGVDEHEDEINIIIARDRIAKLQGIVGKRTLPCDLVLARIVPIDETEERQAKEGDDYLAKEGESYVGPGFCSTSADMDWWIDASRYRLKKGMDFALRFIRAPKGTPAVIMPQMDPNRNEHEVLLLNGTSFKVLSEENVDGIVVQEVEVVSSS